MYVVCVTFVINPKHIADFRQLVRTQARLSLEQEKECHVFDVCLGENSENTVFLYEKYGDESAFKAHLKTHHFNEFDAKIKAMVEEKTVTIYQELDGA